VSDATITEWVHAAIDGNDDAFAELVYAYQDAVYNLCYRMLNNSAEAEDATQEAFLRAYNNLERYDVARSFKTWVMSIASNYCIDIIRKRRLQLLSMDEPLSSEDMLNLTSRIEDSPERLAIRAEQSEQIQALLETLPPDYKAAVILKYWYDYSYLEIADALDTTEGAVKSRLFRARQMLADHAKWMANDDDEMPSTSALRRRE
jgi:RNA polymerase sigma-70 factor (ECF subfamily)